MRSSSPTKTNIKVNYELANGKKVVCDINGQIPAACTGDYCNNVAGSAPPRGSVSSPGSFGQVPGTRGITDSNENRYPFQQQNPNGQLYYPQPKANQLIINPAANPYLNPQNPVQNPFIYQPSTSSQIISSINGNGKCSVIYIQTNKDNYLKILATYNENYKADFGDWTKMKDASIFTFNVRQILAKVYAANIFSIYNNLKKCLP